MRRLVAELTWLTRLLTDLSVPPPIPVPIFSDSQAAIHIAPNTVFHERTKHVELDCHFVRQQFLSGLISLSYLPSKSQLADLFTKPLSGHSHRSILGKLGLSSFPSNLRRDAENRSPDSSSKYILSHKEEEKKRKADEEEKKRSEYLTEKTNGLQSDLKIVKSKNETRVTISSNKDIHDGLNPGCSFKNNEELHNFGSFSHR